MGFLSREQVYDRFKADASNSSHFVWLLASLRYFETKNHWIFGFIQLGPVTLFALEPLVPGGEGGFSVELEDEFREAWNEIEGTLQPKIVAFVAVYAPFLKFLQNRGFQSVKVGTEPWVDLADFFPRGNSGKGVRSARNQAVHSGVTVEEWPSSELRSDSGKRKTIQDILDEWRSSRLLDLGGFLNSVDPIAFSESRKYFIARSPDQKVQAYLVATPVAGIKGYFLEDLMMRPGAPRGVAELLTLEAMESLQKCQADKASLGVVSLTSVDSRSAFKLPKPVEFTFLRLPKYLCALYNFNGLEIFRKRFKPKFWESIHLAVRNYPSSQTTDSMAWFKVLFAVLRAFKPRLRPSLRWFMRTFTYPLSNYPVTTLVAGASFALFYYLNHFGDLPEWAVARFGFSGGAPFGEWFLRSVVSDLLYFDASHFLVWGTAYFVILRWAEASYRKNFFIPFFLCLTLFDDFINYLVVVMPFEYLRPAVFHDLIAIKDVGGSLCMVALLGLQLTEFRKNREVIFACLAAASVFGFAFDSAHLHSLILNLNHFLFLTLGYIVGKFRFEYEKRKNQRASKGKTPALANELQRKSVKTA